ncbi:FOG: PKD repeat [Richelia intracellularis]|nr:FOG: PKD repeat [Richelia intracellularis]
MVSLTIRLAPTGFKSSKPKIKSLKNLSIANPTALTKKMSLVFSEVVNYPNVNFLVPKRTATRADVAAFIHQALVSNNQASVISSPYIVALTDSTPSQPLAVIIPEGTAIPVRSDKAEKILVTKDETAPLTLTVSQNVITDRGDILIPAGS